MQEYHTTWRSENTPVYTATYMLNFSESKCPKLQTDVVTRDETIPMAMPASVRMGHLGRDNSGDRKRGWGVQKWRHTLLSLAFDLGDLGDLIS